MLSDSIQVPTDDRESEVLYASIVAGTTSVYLSLQLLGHTISTDLAPWATLFGLLSVLSGLADVGLREGKGLKYAAAGVDRLVLSDAEREYHSEAAAFLSAYMLGLPCFCFQPEVSEAVKMLRDAPGSLRLQEPRCDPPRLRTPRHQSEQRILRTKHESQEVVAATRGRRVVAAAAAAAERKVMANIRDTSLPARRGGRGDIPGEPQSCGRGPCGHTVHSKCRYSGGLGRVLVWIMSPVAEMKEWKDHSVRPRRGRRLRTSWKPSRC